MGGREAGTARSSPGATPEERRGAEPGRRSPRHLLYIPTDRRCPAAIRAYADECAFLAGRLGQEVPFLVVESRAGPWLEEHRALLGRLAPAPGVRTYHLTPAAFERFACEVLGKATADPSEALRLHRLLHPSGTSYGAGPNKAALAGAALGALIVHRRDSDTLPLVRHGDPAYPAELEIRAIGRPANAVGLRGRPAASTVPVHVVASAVRGDPLVDRRDLLEAGEEFVRRIEKLADPSANEAELDRFIREYFFEDPQRSYDEDFFELDRTGRTEMCVSCVYRSFLELPEMPLEEVLGTDYLQKDLEHRLGRPVLFHSRKVLHAYDRDRSSRRSHELSMTYALRDLRELLLCRIWSAHNRRIAANRSAFLSPAGLLRSEAYSASLESAVRETGAELAGVVGEFAMIHREASTRMGGQRADLLASIASTAQARAQRLVEEVLRGVEDYCFLVRRWSGLIACARRSGAALAPAEVCRERPWRA